MEQPQMNEKNEEIQVPDQILKYKELFDIYDVKDKKRQHDMLACHEGLAFLNNSTKYCKYEVVKPFNTGLKGTYTQWGSTKTRETPYREVLAAIEYEA